MVHRKISPKTQDALASMVRFALDGSHVYPFMWSFSHGAATCAAAVRIPLRDGRLALAGTDGTGKPRYRLGDLTAHQKLTFLATA